MAGYQARRPRPRANYQPLLGGLLCLNFAQATARRRDLA
jgi:hypothetical protein